MCTKLERIAMKRIVSKQQTAQKYQVTQKKKIIELLNYRLPNNFHILRWFRWNNNSSQNYNCNGSLHNAAQHQHAIEHSETTKWKQQQQQRFAVIYIIRYPCIHNVAVLVWKIVDADLRLQNIIKSDRKSIGKFVWMHVVYLFITQMSITHLE